MHKIIEIDPSKPNETDSITNHLEESFDQEGPSISDNYEIKNTNYTKGIEITQCTFNGSNHFSIWDFSGYEPYHLFYNNFIDDPNCIHLICYNLNQSQQDCFYEIFYWLEFLRSRIKYEHTYSNMTTSCPATSSSSSIFLSNRSSPLAPSTPTLSQTSNFTFLHLNSVNNLKETDSFSHNSHPIQNENLNPNGIKVILIGTHADLDKSCVKKDDQFSSDKANSLKQMIENYYSNDDFFDFTEKSFVLDARAACVTDIKLLIQHLIKLKQSICERLPRCTMFLNRTLYHIQNWRKSAISNMSLSSSMNNLNSSNSLSASSYSINSNNQTNLNKAYKHDPIITWKLFVDEIRRSINPLASDEHLKELIQQLNLMGEIVYLDCDLICYQPEWLCQHLLGNLFAYERYSCVKSSNLNGIYSMDELNEIFQHISPNTQLLKDIFVSFDLCAEWENDKSGELLYEFAALNFLSEPLPLAFHSVKNQASSVFLNHSNELKPTLFIFNGFQIRTSAFHLDRNFNPNITFMNSSFTSSASSIVSLNYTNNLKHSYKSYAVSQLANLFFLIQVNLRYLTNKNYCLDIDIEADKRHSTIRRHNSEPPLNGTLKSPSTAQTNSIRFNQNGHHINNPKNHTNSEDSFTHLNGALIDIELYQTRYCSRLTRKNCHIECLLSLDHINGQYIELRACAPDSWREELFYFVQDLYSFIEHVIYESCTNINLEKHYLSFKPILVHPGSLNPQCVISLGVISYDAIYSPKDIIYMQFQNKQILVNSKRSNETKFINLICCGSEIIEKNIIQGIDLPLGYMNPYTRHMLCVYLDKKDPMGLDWSILAVVLGLQEILPKIDEMALVWSQQTKHFSKTECVLNEWCKIKQEQATIRNLLNKIADLGRKDVFDMMLNTINLFICGMCKDSGIQNSYQTLASIK